MGWNVGQKLDRDQKLVLGDRLCLANKKIKNKVIWVFLSCTLEFIESSSIYGEKYMLTAIEGVYKDGEIELVELPEGQDADLGSDPDDTPISEIKASLTRALQEAKAGQRIPISQMWEGIDVE